MLDRERRTSGPTPAVGARSRTARQLIRMVAGAVLALGVVLAGSSVALADGLVIGVSVSERPTSSGPETSLEPSGTSGAQPPGTTPGGTTPGGPGPGGTPTGTETVVDVDPGGTGEHSTGGTGTDDDLASTGLSTFWLVAPAALLVTAGALALVLARRRRSAGAHAA